MTRYTIETAPRNGTEVIGWDAAGKAALIAWCTEPDKVEKHLDHPETEPGWYRRAEGQWDLFDGFALQAFYPIEWAPLPEPNCETR